jgi:hypothetical protein
LKGVLHVPRIGRNLFSVWKAALLNINTVHSKNGCKLIQNGETLIEGTMEGTMYKLLMHIVTPIHGAYVANSFGTETKKASTQSIDIWHRRLCHVNHTIKKMAAEAMVDGLILSNTSHSSFCTSCAYGKIQRKPFPWKDHRQRSAQLGDLTHSDVCGPMSVPTVGGALYFVLFKDDHSGFRVVHCIKKKSDVLSYLKKYAVQLKRETGQTMKVLRSYRGSEFNNAALREFLAANNITQDLTCPYTPEQNGATKRENRSIMEAARSMLHSSHVHLKF